VLMVGFLAMGALEDWDARGELVEWVLKGPISLAGVSRPGRSSLV
jgi:hypothetical protein